MSSLEISTAYLRNKVILSIERLTPLFNLSPEELKEARKFGIERDLKGLPALYKDCSENVAAYSSLHRFFFFPSRDIYSEVLPMDSDAVIFHEASHHLHAVLNHETIGGILVFAKTGKRPLGHANLCELVAEYPVKILGLADYTKPPYLDLHPNLIRIYQEYGPEFLPTLARMSLGEAIKKRIVQ